MSGPSFRCDVGDNSKAIRAPQHTLNIHFYICMIHEGHHWTCSCFRIFFFLSRWRCFAFHVGPLWKLWPGIMHNNARWFFFFSSFPVKIFHILCFIRIGLLFAFKKRLQTLVSRFLVFSTLTACISVFWLLVPVGSVLSFFSWCPFPADTTCGDWDESGLVA